MKRLVLARAEWLLSDDPLAAETRRRLIVLVMPLIRQAMDVWLAQSKKPTPAVFYIHGGGWGAQDKTAIHPHLDVHDDMADTQSVDSVARESTRVIFTATKAPQPSLDPMQLVEWIPNSNYGQNDGIPGEASLQAALVRVLRSTR